MATVATNYCCLIKEKEMYFCVGTGTSIDSKNNRKCSKRRRRIRFVILYCLL